MTIMLSMIRCPAGHEIMGVAYDSTERSPADVDRVLGTGLIAALLAGQNPWCGICYAPLASWRLPAHEPTPYESLDEFESQAPKDHEWRIFS